jgi:hypothetical protein
VEMIIWKGQSRMCAAYNERGSGWGSLARFWFASWKKMLVGGSCSSDNTNQVCNLHNVASSSLRVETVWVRSKSDELM